MRAKGAQDKYLLESGPEFYDAKKQFLTNKHINLYQKLNAKHKSHVHNTKKTIQTMYEFEVTSDFINNVDLVLPNPDNLHVNEILKRITLEIGGQRIDSICADDIYTQIATNNKLFNLNGVSHKNGKTIIPLSIATLHSFNLLQPRPMNHDVQLWIDYKEDYKHYKDVEFYGNTYFLDQGERRSLVEQPHNFIVFQNQYTGAERMKNGTNTFKLCSITQFI